MLVPPAKPVLLSYALGQGSPMIAAIWGVFIWKEFRSAKKSVYGLVQRYLTFGHSR